MTIIELENKLNFEGLKTVFDRGVKKKYITEKQFLENGIPQNMINVFGIYQQNDEFIFFITDDERGTAKFIKYCATEEEACKALYERISLLKQIHEKTKFKVD